MTSVSLSLLIYLIIAAVLLALALLAARALGRRRVATLSDLENLFDASPDRYAQLGRILGHDDFDFVRGCRGGASLLGPMRRQRARLMIDYLKQMKREFESLHAIGWLFAAAPTAQAEKFARQLIIQRIRFHLSFWALTARALANYVFHLPFDVTLRADLQKLRRQADRLLHALTPNDLIAIRNFLRSH